MGPTASGKTALAIFLAKYFNTGIISVDARQVYREISIGTAKPTKEQLDTVPHHFINELSIDQPFSAGAFAREAIKRLEELFQTKDIIVAAGGSTLYFKALLEGVDEFPPLDSEVRSKLNEVYRAEGIIALQSLLREKDPEYYAKVDQNNPARLKRALEVSLSTGKPYSSYLNRDKPVLPFNVLKIGLEIPRKDLYRQIDMRCDAMMEAGLLEEVSSLYRYRNLQALQTVGYTEFFDYLDGKLNLDEAITLFKQHTRNYAKRQLTWFGKEKDLRWFSPADLEEIIDWIENSLQTT
jgi:tRNA dimethylallyltransferase